MKMRRKIAKAAALGPADMKADDRRGSALINVRRPDLERRAGNLEAQSHEHEGGGDGHEDGRGAELPTRCGSQARLVVPVMP